jgi:hypothetical protein
MSEAMTEVESLARHLAASAGLDPDARVAVQIPHEVHLPGHVGRLLDHDLKSAASAWHFYRSMAQAALAWRPVSAGMGSGPPVATPATRMIYPPMPGVKERGRDE